MTTQVAASVVEMVRNATRDGQWHVLYVMVPADDGGQSCEMKCKICGEFGNILASKFVHNEGCPVATDEGKLNGRS